MIFQYIFLVLIVGTALGYVIRKIREPFRSKNDCGASCGKCKALENLEMKKEN
jgi:hypothetical protein